MRQALVGDHRPRRAFTVTSRVERTPVSLTCRQHSPLYVIYIYVVIIVPVIRLMGSAFILKLSKFNILIALSRASGFPDNRPINAD